MFYSTRVVDSITEIFRTRLKQARKSKGLSQEEAAEKLETHSETISRWERGERQPSIRDLQKISEQLGRPPAWFFLAPKEEVVSSEKAPFNPVEAIEDIHDTLEQIRAVLDSQGPEPDPDGGKRVASKPARGWATEMRANDRSRQNEAS